MRADRFKIYLTLLLLYVAQSVPMSFFSSAIPAIMREQGYSLEQIGLLQLVKLPWIFKLFWSPMVDRVAPTLSKLRRGIIFSELFYALTLIVISQFSLSTNFQLIAILVTIAIIFSANQDVCTDSFSIKILQKEGFSLGAGVQSMGGFVGALIGGGVLLIVYSYLGWQMLLYYLAIYLILSLIPLFWVSQRAVSAIEEEDDDDTTKRKDDKELNNRVKISDFTSFFKQKHIAKHMIFLLLFNAPTMLVMAMLRPLMVDYNLSIETVGVVMGVVGTSLAAVMAMAVALIVKRKGAKIAIVLTSLLITFAMMVLFLVMVVQNPSNAMLFAAIGLVWAGHGGATTIIYHFSMEKSREKCSAADFTFQSVIVQLSGLILSVVGSQLAAATSYKYLFLIASLFGVITLIYNMFYYKAVLGTQLSGTSKISLNTEFRTPQNKS